MRGENKIGRQHLKRTALIYIRQLNSRFPTSCIQFVPSGDEVIHGMRITVSDEARQIATVTLEGQ